MAQLEVYFAETQDFDLDQGVVYLHDWEAHHLMHVRRARTGEVIIVIDGKGGAWSATVYEFQPDRVSARLLQAYKRWREPPLRIYLGLGVLKGDRFTQAIEQAVQMGASEIVPLLTQYVVASWSATRSERAWRIALAAAKQTGRGLIPPVLEAQPLHQWCIEKGNCDHKLLLVPEGKSFPEVQNEENVALAIGCEGGFSREEERWMIGKGFIPVSLGPRRLRSETAVAVALSRILADLE